MIAIESHPRKAPPWVRAEGQKAVVVIDGDSNYSSAAAYLQDHMIVSFGRATPAGVAGGPNWAIEAAGVKLRGQIRGLLDLGVHHQSAGRATLRQIAYAACVASRFGYAVGLVHEDEVDLVEEAINSAAATCDHLVVEEGRIVLASDRTVIVQAKMVPPNWRHIWMWLECDILSAARYAARRDAEARGLEGGEVAAADEAARSATDAACCAASAAESVPDRRAALASILELGSRVGLRGEGLILARRYLDTTA